jgi:hypothetical protein
MLPDHSFKILFEAENIGNTLENMGIKLPLN